MDPDDLIRSRNQCSAADADRAVPDNPGYYAIFIDVPASLDKSFGNVLQERDTNLIYVGIATRSLKDRLVDQDLRGKSNSTFFRSIGAIRGFSPERGTGGRTGKNFRFSDSTAREIVSWIDDHLCVRWVKHAAPTKAAEKGAIERFRPLLNIVHNADKLRDLEELRAKCRRIARGMPDGRNDMKEQTEI
jgi:hypothetical protein